MYYLELKLNHGAPFQGLKMLSRKVSMRQDLALWDMLYWAKKVRKPLLSGSIIL